MLGGVGLDDFKMFTLSSDSCAFEVNLAQNLSLWIYVFNVWLLHCPIDQGLDIFLREQIEKNNLVLMKCIWKETFVLRAYGFAILLLSVM